MQCIKLDDIIKAMVNEKISLNSALVMDSATYIHNDTVDDCINAIKKCEILNVTSRNGEYTEI